MNLSAPFAAEPVYTNLIRIRGSLPVGNWRDSNKGLAGGEPWRQLAQARPAQGVAACACHPLSMQVPCYIVIAALTMCHKCKACLTKNLHHLFPLTSFDTQSAAV